MSDRDKHAIDRSEKGVLEEIVRLARPSLPHAIQNVLWAAGFAGLFLSVSILVREQDLRLRELLGYVAIVAFALTLGALFITAARRRTTPQGALAGTVDLDRRVFGCRRAGVDLDRAHHLEAHGQ